MRNLARAVALGFVLCLAVTASAAPSVRSLISRLEHGSDFRIRMRAALELGKLKHEAGRAPLERALGDESPAVRAAAAAALEVHGDRRAIPALERRLRDPSSSVRAQVKAALDALRRQPADEEQAGDSPVVLVHLGDVSAAKKSGVSRGAKAKLAGEIKRAARSRLAKLPGVKVMHDSEDAAARARQGSVPVVLLTGRIRRAELSREGGRLVYSAKVEYVVHRMPGRAIASLVSGSAQGEASESVARDRKKLAALRSEVLAAAVASAMRRAPEAIRAAMK